MQNVVWPPGMVTVHWMFNLICNLCRGGIAGPAGPALAGPLFSGSLVSFPDCRNSLRTRPNGGSGARRGPTRLHQHPYAAKYTCVYDVQLLVIWHILLLAVVPLLSLALRIGLLQRLPTSLCLSCFRKDHLERRTLCTGLFSQVGLLLESSCTTMKPPTLFYVNCAVCEKKTKPGNVDVAFVGWIY